MNKRVELTPTLLVGIALVILAVGFVAGTRSQQIYAFLGPVFGVRTSVETLDTTSLQSTFQALSAYYNGKLDENKLIEGAKEGMVAATGDPYTTYLTADEASEFQKELTGEIGGGIGAEIGIRSGQPTIIRTLPDNPAEKAGLHAGDVIVAVNDESADGWDAEQTVTAIKGEEGTTVKLVVRRGSTTKNFSITRAIINNPSVSSSLEGNVGIITLNRFDEQTNSLVRKAASSLKNRGMKRLVLDLRGNGGGYLDAAPAVAGLWLDDKLVVSVRSSDGQSQKLYSKGDQLLAGVPTSILVNAGTASASEILAAALKHYKVATIVGEKTFGKGTVQELVNLEGGAQLKVTIKRWYTPSGSNINQKGIKPDFSVGLTQSDLDKNRDPQLEKALSVLRS
ncbi:MAG TPA: S41 family peptidase [Candidatus Saccharibacteria bacterium]|nr:S41 family peptidase [Candidatus Saccharibacteria bacterium]HRK94364.1 S41 family peptidase [Candidatus Saccharibacteria bacterium]